MNAEEKAREFFSSEDTQEYKDFVEKFKPKRTPDECYTPPEVFEVVKSWVLDRCPHLRDYRICRPFYPGGDYKAEDYTGCVVIDNPPFSFLADIKRFYIERQIPFFLFAPALTLFSSQVGAITFIVANAKVTFENGAKVPISFVSNLFGDTAIILSSDLKWAIEKAQSSKKTVKKRAEYVYPPHVVSSTLLGKYINRGINLEIKWREVFPVNALDAQISKRIKIFGGGFLVSDEVVWKLQRALQQSSIRATEWELTRREWDIVHGLGRDTSRE